MTPPKKKMQFDTKTRQWEEIPIVVKTKPLIDRETWNKFLEQEDIAYKEEGKRGFEFYRARGLAIRQLLKKGEWNKELRKEYCQRYKIKSATLRIYLQLADMTEEEFANTVSKFRSIHEWRQKPRKESNIITIKALLGLFEVKLTNTENLEKFLTENNISLDGIYVLMKVNKDKVKEIKDKLRELKHGRFIA